MTATMLTLRVGRRGMAAVLLDHEGFTFVDAHYLPSNRGRAVRAAARYVDRLVGMLMPKTVVVEAEHSEDSQTASIVKELTNALAKRGVGIVLLDVAEVLDAFGLPGLRARTQVRGVVAELFPALRSTRGFLDGYVADAAATALLADTRVALGIIGA